jgi:hypothetical protein
VSLTDTSPQAAFNLYRQLMAKTLNWPEDEIIVRAMSLGYADDAKVESKLLTSRVPLESFVRFHC